MEIVNNLIWAIKVELNTQDFKFSGLIPKQVTMPQPCPEPNQAACVLSKLALKPAQLTKFIKYL
jgi:hypothetical protein